MQSSSRSLRGNLLVYELEPDHPPRLYADYMHVHVIRLEAGGC